MLSDRWVVYAYAEECRRAEIQCDMMGIKDRAVKDMEQANRILQGIWSHNNFEEKIVLVLDLREEEWQAVEPSLIKKIVEKIKSENGKEGDCKGNWKLTELQSDLKQNGNAYTYLIANMKSNEAMTGKCSQIQKIKQIIDTVINTAAPSAHINKQFNILISNGSQISQLAPLVTKMGQPKVSQHLQILKADAQYLQQESLLPDPSEFPSSNPPMLPSQSEQKDFDPLKLQKQTIAASKLIKKNKQIMDLKRAMKQMAEQLASVRSQNLKLMQIVESTKIQKQNGREDNGQQVIRKKWKVEQTTQHLQRQLVIVQTRCRRLQAHKSRSQTTLSKYRQSILELQRKNVALQDEISIAKYSDITFKS